MQKNNPEKEVRKTLVKKNVEVYIWSRKEIENYLRQIDTIYRICESRIDMNAPFAQTFTRDILESKINQIIESFKTYVQSQLVSQLLKEKKGFDESSIIYNFLVDFEEKWQDPIFKISSIPGKEFFNNLNIQESEINPEIKETPYVEVFYL